MEKMSKILNVKFYDSVNYMNKMTSKTLKIAMMRITRIDIKFRTDYRKTNSKQNNLGLTYPYKTH